MLHSDRLAYNQAFSDQKYQSFLDDLQAHYGVKIDFRVAETPVFLPTYLKDRLLEAGEQIIDTLCAPDFEQISAGAVPSDCLVPGQDAHTLFLALDFAICNDETGKFVPQLIELQGFPSLYCFQDFVAAGYRKHFDISENKTHLFGGRSSEQYLKLLKTEILGGYDPKHVILLEIEPEKQKTKIDFYCTKEYIGIDSVCISKIIQEGAEIFYYKNDEKIKIKRIYNRIIFDELQARPDIIAGFQISAPIDAEWAGHPNWFFKISKHTLPFLDSQYVPKTEFLDQIVSMPKDLENYVLKPLYSFAGMGVVYNVSSEDIEKIPIDERKNYILMKKVQYAPCLLTPDGAVKVEIRMLYLWPKDEPRPLPLTNLARLSRGVMIGVRFNQDKTWVGGSLAFFDK